MCSHHRRVPTFKEGDEAEGQRPSHQAKEQGQRDIQLPPVCGPALQTPHNTTYLPALFTAQDKRHAPSGLPAPPLSGQELTSVGVPTLIVCLTLNLTPLVSD